MDCTEYRSNHVSFSRLPLPRGVWDTPEWSDWMDHFHGCRDCFDWTLAKRIAERGFDPDTFPCVHIGNQVTRACPDHPDPADCPDILISYFARFDEYSIAVRDGGTSAVPIRNRVPSSNFHSDLFAAVLIVYRGYQSTVATELILKLQSYVDLEQRAMFQTL